MRSTRELALKFAATALALSVPSVPLAAIGGVDSHPSSSSSAIAAVRAAIRALREVSNRAIAAHDLVRFTPIFADDAVFVWSNGTSAVGKAALSRSFAEDFADPLFIAYIRTPRQIAISDRGVRAVEHGTWKALKRGTVYGGDYAAHWFKTDRGWRVHGELYVKLHCKGPLCLP